MCVRSLRFPCLKYLTFLWLQNTSNLSSEAALTLFLLTSAAPVYAVLASQKATIQQQQVCCGAQHPFRSKVVPNLSDCHRLISAGTGCVAALMAFYCLREKRESFSSAAVGCFVLPQRVSENVSYLKEFHPVHLEHRRVNSR